jgi:hypothetical protein
MNFIHQDTETLEENITSYNEEDIEDITCSVCGKKIGKKDFTSKYQYNPLMGVIFCCYLIHKSCSRKK